MDKVFIPSGRAGRCRICGTYGTRYLCPKHRRRAESLERRLAAGRPLPADHPFASNTLTVTAVRLTGFPLLADRLAASLPPESPMSATDISAVCCPACPHNRATGIHGICPSCQAAIPATLKRFQQKGSLPGPDTNARRAILHVKLDQLPAERAAEVRTLRDVLTLGQEDGTSSAQPDDNDDDTEPPLLSETLNDLAETLEQLSEGIDPGDDDGTAEAEVIAGANEEVEAELADYVGIRRPESDADCTEPSALRLVRLKADRDQRRAALSRLEREIGELEQALRQDALAEVLDDWLPDDRAVLLELAGEALDVWWPADPTEVTPEWLDELPGPFAPELLAKLRATLREQRRGVRQALATALQDYRNTLETELLDHCDGTREAS